jgi:hypothetical protein
VYSRFLSCSLIICCMRVVVPVEHVLSHCCNMSGTIKNIYEGVVVLRVLCCDFVCVCTYAILSTVVAQLVVLRWCLDVVHVVFRRSMIFFPTVLFAVSETVKFCICDVDVNVDLSCRWLRNVCKLSLCNYLLEYCLVTWLLGAVVLSRVVGTGLRFLLCNVGSNELAGGGAWGRFLVLWWGKCVDR